MVKPIKYSEFTLRSFKSRQVKTTYLGINLLSFFIGLLFDESHHVLDLVGEREKKMLISTVYIHYNEYILLNYIFL